MDKKIHTHKTLKKLIFLLVIFSFLSSAGFALALEVQYPTILGFSIDNTSTISEFLCYIFGAIVNLTIFVALFIIAFGGIYYLVSYGRGKVTSEAKDWIKAGITGLLIVVCAYLISYTINPNLTTCKIGVLSLVNFDFSKNSYVSPNAVTATYKEIPIGMLTESLLTKTTDCYDFDQNGNPINGNYLPTNKKCTKDANCSSEEICNTTTKKCEKYAPTYMDKDRVDCLVQLASGAQKKAQIIQMLSKEIQNIMDKCDCNGVCTALYPNCDFANGPRCDCGGPCEKCKPTAACTAISGDMRGGDCCTKGEGPINPITGLHMAYSSTKPKIEHGPIKLSFNAGGATECRAESVEYAGLDEFRCPNPKDTRKNSTPCSNIMAFVEKKVEINKKWVTVIDQKKWNKLNLLQQLAYFKEKIGEREIEKKIEKDVAVIDQAKLALGNCYLLTPSVDLLKNKESIKAEEKVILVQKDFADPETKEKIDISKYCGGFNYNNSSCLKKCNDTCPDTSPQAIALYKEKTSKCNQNDPEYETCLSEKIEEAYNSRPCTYAEDTSQTFNKKDDKKSCMASCQNDCLSVCDKKYFPCSDELDFCKSQCKDNGQCVLDNANSCLFGAENFYQCAIQSNPNDPENTNYCIDRAYSCENGSDQYSGYLKCAEPSAPNCQNFSSQTNCENSSGCTWDSKITNV